MAHFIQYKRQAEVMTFDFDFSQILPTTDTMLDTLKTSIKVFDSAGQDQTNYFLQKITFNGFIAEAVLVNGLEGEDYSVYVYGVGNVSQGTPTPNRILEVRVRQKIAGNL